MGTWYPQDHPEIEIQECHCQSDRISCRLTSRRCRKAGCDGVTAVVGVGVIVIVDIKGMSGD